MGLWEGPLGVRITQCPYCDQILIHLSSHHASLEQLNHQYQSTRTSSALSCRSMYIVFGNRLDDRRPASLHIALVLCLLVPVSGHTISCPYARATLDAFVHFKGSSHMVQVGHPDMGKSNWVFTIHVNHPVCAHRNMSDCVKALAARESPTFCFSFILPVVDNTHSPTPTNTHTPIPQQ
jgi:hypothetical protein